MKFITIEIYIDEPTISKYIRLILTTGFGRIFFREFTLKFDEKYS